MTKYKTLAIIGFIASNFTLCQIDGDLCAVSKEIKQKISQLTIENMPQKSIYDQYRHIGRKEGLMEALIILEYEIHKEKSNEKIP